MKHNAMNKFVFENDELYVYLYNDRLHDGPTQLLVLFRFKKYLSPDSALIDIIKHDAI